MWGDANVTTYPKAELRTGRTTAPGNVTLEAERAERDATARHLKALYREAGRPGATEHPEFGCVAWYLYPHAPKDR